MMHILMLAAAVAVGLYGGFYLTANVFGMSSPTGGFDVQDAVVVALITLLVVLFV